MDKKKIKRFIARNQMNLAIGAVSLLAFIIGIFAIGFLKSFLIVGIIDLCLFAPTILNMIKKKSKGGNTKASKTSSPKEKKPKKKKKKRKIFRKILLGFFIFCVILGIIACIAAALFFKQIAKEAPQFDPNKLDRQEASIFYDSKGKELAKVGLEKREKITYDQMSENLINAIIATEDSRYFSHNGFDLPRFLKASVNQVLGKGGGGASTITMQVSKNNYTSRNSSGIEGIKRKFTDIYMSMFQLEKTYTKEEILEFYVNDNYLGGSSYGVEQASLTYFNKHAKDLNLAEAAMIAGLFQSPGGYDPFLFPEACESRRQTVLYLMERHGYITSEEREIAAAMTVEKILNPQTTTSDNGNPYMGFINLVISEINQDLGIDPYTTSMKVYTTLDTTKQDSINDVLTGKTYNWKNPAVDLGAALINNNTGEIVAISNGRHHMYDVKVSNVASAKQQIGSTAKPLFDYGPAIEYLNWSTGQLIVDEEHSYTGSTGKVNNWDLKFNGMMTIQEALRTSRNIPAIKTFQALKASDITTFVTNLHLSPENSNGVLHEAHAIGGYSGESPINLAAAYSAFANGGYYITPHSYTKVELRETNEVHNKKIEKSRAMSEETAYMVMHMLVQTPSYALGAFSKIPGVTYGAKTGTTNFDDATFKAWNLPVGAVNDSWVVGSSPNYTLSLWYGYDHLIKENVQKGYVNNVSDYQHTLLFQKLGTALFEKGTSFKKPSGVIEVTLEKESYPLALPSEHTPSDMKTTALFKKGTEPTETSSRFATLSNVTNLKGSASGNEVTLSWNGITPSNYYGADALKTTYKDLFLTDKKFNEYIDKQVSYNNSHIGTLEYRVYRKNADGSLTSITKTTNTEITFTDSDAYGDTTYVVKSCYSILTSAISSGVDISVSLDGTAPPEDSDISILINGVPNIKVSENNQFDETGRSYVIVTERIDGILTDVTSSANIEVSHPTFDYTKSGSTYKATLKVTYKSASKNIELNITIE